MKREPCHAHITAVRVRSFKSFGRDSSNFAVPSAHLNCIVGPNGSGKSNLLEAICFASGIPTSALRVKTLQELQSTEGNANTCEVCLELSEPLRSHEILATLGPDGSRVYKVDGKVKTGAQVKGFLRSVGIYLDTTTVIRQASVTHLADSNRPESVAEVISNASGFRRWTDETQVAEGEIRTTRKALQEIHLNLEQLAAVVAEKEERVAAARQRLFLQGEQRKEGKNLLRALDRHLTYLHRGEELEGDQLVQYQAALPTLVRECEALDKEVGTRTRGVQRGPSNLAEVDRTRLRHVQCVEEVQEKVAALQRDLDQLINHRMELQVLHQDVAQYDLAVAQQQEALLRCVEEGQQLEALLAGMVGNDGDDQKAAHFQLSTLQQTHHLLEDKCMEWRNQSAEGHAKIKKLEAEVDRLALQKCRISSESSPLTSATQRSELTQTLHGIASITDDLRRLDRKHHEAEAKLEVLRDRHHQQDNLNLPPGARPLYHCFAFRDVSDPQLEPLLLPLSLIAGSSVRVIVVDNYEVAQSLLQQVATDRAAAPRQKLRIWPLTGLCHSDNTKAQEAARLRYGTDKVFLPMEFLCCPDSYQIALTRALGSFLIARDDATASLLSSEAGLCCVTLEGVKSQPGTISGGWVPGGGPNLRLWQLKLQLQTAEEDLMRIDRAKGEKVEQLQGLEHRKAKLETELNVMEEAENTLRQVTQQHDFLACDLVRIRSEVFSLSCQLSRGEEELREVAERIREYRELEDLLDAPGSGGLKVVLMKDLERNRLQKAKAESDLDALMVKLDTASSKVEALSARLSSLPDENSVREQIRSCREEMATLKQQEQEQLAADMEEAAKKAKEECDLMALVKQQEEKRRSKKELSDTIRGVQSRLAVLQKDILKWERKKAEVMKKLARETWDQSVSAAHQGDESCTDEEEVQYNPDRGVQGIRSLESILNSLNARLAALPQSAPLLTEVAEVDRDKENLAGMMDRAATLKAAVDVLEEGIRSTKEVVEDINDQVCETVASKFLHLCGEVLPSLELSLARVGQRASEGVVFKFRMKVEGPEAPWHQNLDQLSGGQRTLVPLTLLLAAAQAGTPSHVMLMDEIDAALDEHNQQAVVGLLWSMAHQPDGGCQVLCVSHHLGFQQHCDGVIRVTRDHQGTRVTACAMKDKQDKQDKKITKKHRR